MEKNTIIAVVLSVVIITAGFLVQNTFFAPKPGQVSETVKTVPAEKTAVQDRAFTEEGKASSSYSSQAGSQFSGAPKVFEDPDLKTLEIRAETDVFDITFSNRGGVITSLKLKNHIDGSKPLEMINRGASDLAAFTLSFGPPGSEPVDVPFSHRIRRNVKGNIESIEFERNFEADGVPFTLKKTFVFHDDDYMVELRSVLRTVKDYQTLTGMVGLTVCSRSQIGPNTNSMEGMSTGTLSFTGGKKALAKLKNIYLK